MKKKVVCPNCGELMKDVAIGWRCEKCKGFTSFLDGKFYGHVEKSFAPPMTNADRIRAMSDEELAWELIQYRDDFGDYCTHNGCYATQKGALEAEIEWLKQPAEVGNG